MTPSPVSFHLVPRVAIAGAVVFLGTALTGCGREEDPVADPAAREYAVEHLADRVAMISSVPSWSRSIDEMLPNVGFSVDGADPVSLVDSVVVGEINDAAPGRSQVMLEEPDGPLAMVEFENPQAMVRTVHLSVDVAEELGSSVADDRITVGLAIGANVDPEMVMRGLESMGPVLLFLRDDSAVFDYDDSLYSIGGNGTFLGVIGDGGEVDFPIIRRTEGSGVPDRRFVGVTLDALREAASAPERVIPMTTPESGFPQRSGS